MSNAKGGVVVRKRGRPVGKDRDPLSQEEKRARNTKYERERRLEHSVALADLEVAAHCSADMTTAEILLTTINKLQSSKEIKDESKVLKRLNKKLEKQIFILEQRLNMGKNINGHQKQ